MVIKAVFVFFQIVAVKSGTIPGVVFQPYVDGVQVGVNGVIAAFPAGGDMYGFYLLQALIQCKAAIGCFFKFHHISFPSFFVVGRQQCRPVDCYAVKLGHMEYFPNGKTVSALRYSEDFLLMRHFWVFSPSVMVIVCAVLAVTVYVQTHS